MSVLRSFGRNPSGKDVEIIKSSPNYVNGVFKNLSHTDSLVKGANFVKIMWRFFNKPKNTMPPKPLPSVMTNLRTIKHDLPTIIWFGHSSYLLAIDGKNILVDPVLSDHASPFSFTAKSFKGSDVYSVDDLPPIDILLISHDHYDHLDYKVVEKLGASAGCICTSKGVGSHLRYWGIDPA